MKSDRCNTIFSYQLGKPSRLRTGDRWKIILHAQALTLTELVHSGTPAIAFFLTNDKGTTISELREKNLNPINYSVYGAPCDEAASDFEVRFNSELHSSALAAYLLGNGSRSFSPSIMRFRSPDPYSPFEQGGFNSYTYCLDDPVNNVDPSGHNPLKPLISLLKGIGNRTGLRQSRATQNQSNNISVIHSSSEIYQMGSGNDSAPLPYSYFNRTGELTTSYTPFNNNESTRAQIQALNQQAHDLEIRANQIQLFKINRRVLNGKTPKQKYTLKVREYRLEAENLKKQANNIRDRMAN